MENNNRAVIYARVSSTTERQSTERQVSDLEVLAKSRNMRIEKIYEEKISGAKKNSERAVLTECLEYCFSEGIGTLLISELSRLGRNVDEVLKNVMLCKEKGLNVHFQEREPQHIRLHGQGASIPYHLHCHPRYCGCDGEGEYQLPSSIGESTVYRQGRQGRQKTGIQKAGGRQTETICRCTQVTRQGLSYEDDSWYRGSQC